MMSFVLAQLRAFFGGGASYLFLGLGAAILFQYWQILDLRQGQAALKAERDQAVATAKEKDTVIVSQARQYQRQVQTRKDEANAEDIINAVPDSEQCIRSASINSAIGWLREHEAGAAETDHDKPDVRLPRETGSTE